MSKRFKIKGLEEKWSGSLRPLQLKKLGYQALIKMIPDDVLESFILQKSNHINNLQKRYVSKSTTFNVYWLQNRFGCAR